MDRQTDKTQNQTPKLAKQLPDGSPNQLQSLLGHPSLWRARQLQSPTQSTPAIPSGFTQLDEQLPGQGWPQAGLVECLLSSSGTGELRLLVPVLKTLSHQQNRWVAWVNPPFVPYAPALQSVGVDISKILLIHPNPTSRPDSSHRSAHRSAHRKDNTKDQHWQNILWSLERAAKSGTCSMVLAWVDEKRLTLRDTQRLQNAAKQGNTLICLMRPAAAAKQASMAELRLALQPTEAAGMVALDIVKRRGGWPVSNLQLNVAQASNTQHRTAQEIHEQLTLWRAGSMPISKPAQPSAEPTGYSPGALRDHDHQKPQPSIH